MATDGKVIKDAWEVLEAAEVNYGDVLAIVDQERLLTYHELAERSRRLAWWMVNQGVNRGDAVAICSRNCSFVMEVHFAAAYIHASKLMYNVLKKEKHVGGKSWFQLITNIKTLEHFLFFAVVVNVNVALAGPEIEYILEDGKCKIIFADMSVHEHVLAAFSSSEAPSKNLPQHIIWMDIDGKPESMKAFSPHKSVKFSMYIDCMNERFEEQRLVEKRKIMLSNASSEDAFHSYYTSGTTGHPKPVLLNHKIVMYHAIATIKGI